MGIQNIMKQYLTTTAFETSVQNVQLKNQTMNILQTWFGV